MTSCLFNPLRYWDDQANPLPELDSTDAELDREDSLSERYAFQLGESFGVLRLAVSDDWPCHEMERGYVHGLTAQARHGDIYVRKLLTLRRNAFARGIPVSAGLTVGYLKRITVTACPVSGEALTQGALAGSDWSVDRLDNSIGYVPGNVCFVSRRVNEIKGRSDFEPIANAALEGLMLEGMAGLKSDVGNGLLALEALRISALMAAPSALSRGKLAKYLPLAMAPGVWATPEAAVAGIHVRCARTRVPGAEYGARVALYKRLGKETWHASNKLVDHIACELRRGAHPADIWLDGLASELLMLLSAELLQRPPEVRSLLDGEIVATLNSNAVAFEKYRR